MGILNLVLTDLGLERMKAEERLQVMVNSNKDVDDKINDIKGALKEIVTINNMVDQWRNYMPTDEPNNNK